MAVEVDAVLAGNVIQDYRFRDTIHSIEGFAESKVHVHLSFALLKIYDACWHEAIMPGASNGPESSSIKMVMRTMGTFDGMVLIASRFLQDSLS